MTSTTHTLTIQIDPASVPILRSCGLTLCLSKGLTITDKPRWENPPNVVFSSIPPIELIENLKFEWRDAWRVGQVDELEHLDKAQEYVESYGYHPIALGQTLDLDNGDVHPHSDSENAAAAATSFRILYPYRNTRDYGAQTQVLIELFDTLHNQFSPIFASPEINRGETIEFTPDERCWVWFDGLLEGGRMYKRGKTQRWPFEVDLSLGKGVRYQDGVWGYVDV